MALEIPKWLTDLALVGVIFSAGGVYFTSVGKIEQLEKDVASLQNENKLLEQAITAHHGLNWQTNIKEITPVDDLKSNYHETKSTFNKTLEKSESQIANTTSWVSSIRKWAVQQDALVRQETLNRFRAIAVYTNSKALETKHIYINKQHVKGSYYKKGDRVLIENPLPPARQAEVVVEGFIDDPINANVLVQLNESLLEQLGLTTVAGRYELFITNDPQVLRWKSLENIHVSVN